MAQTYHKFIVLCVAGQSNAVGYDESLVELSGFYENKTPERIKQLGFYGEENLKLIPLSYFAHSMQDMRVHNNADTSTPGTKGIHLPLANLLLDYIPEDYGILILPIAYGGTGFTCGMDGSYDETLKKPAPKGPGEGTAILKWGKDTAYYKTLRDRITYALGLHPENKFAGILWCQGENDAPAPQEHRKAFEEMTEALFSSLNEGGLGDRTAKGFFDKDLWYNMETVSYWYTLEGCVEIWNNYKKWNPNTYIEIPRKTDSNEINGTGQTAQNRGAHFGNNSYATVIAPLVLKKLLECKTIPTK